MDFAYLIFIVMMVFFSGCAGFQNKCIDPISGVDICPKHMEHAERESDDE